MEGQLELLQVVHAGDALGLRLRLGQGGQEHAGQNGNDRNDHQKFDEGERAPRPEVHGVHGWG